MSAGAAGVWRAVLWVALALLVVASADAQQPPPASEAAKIAGTPPERTGPPLDPRALEILKASSARLAAARSMTFTAIASYESPSRPGPALVYTTRSEVTLQRPNKLRVLTPGDGPASEFYYDGKRVMAFAPAENLVAVAEAPPTLEAMLEAAYHEAAIYFPFTDVIVADPFAAIEKGLELAFYIGQSSVVGGVKTDMVAYATQGVFVQLWVGADDKLPRRARAVFRDDPLRLRHQVEFSAWKLGAAVPAGAFSSTRAAKAKPIPFGNPRQVRSAP